MRLPSPVAFLGAGMLATAPCRAETPAEGGAPAQADADALFLPPLQQRTAWAAGDDVDRVVRLPDDKGRLSLALMVAR